MNKKIAAYGLDKSYNYFASGSDAVVIAAMVSAWDKKAPIVAYYWEPTGCWENTISSFSKTSCTTPNAITRDTAPALRSR